MSHAAPQHQFPTSVAPGAYGLWRLTMLAAVAVMTSRVATHYSAPTLANFLHFPVVALLFVLALPYFRTRVFARFTNALLLFAGAIIASAFLNGAGMLNAALEFMLLAEPFLLLLAMTVLPWSSRMTRQFRWLLLAIVIVHVAIAYYQRFGQGLVDDGVKGLFLEQGAGHHVAGAVALSAAIFFAMYGQEWGLWTRIIFAVIAGNVVILSDSKQVLAVFLGALVVQIAMNMRRFGKMMRYVLYTAIASAVIAAAAYTVFPALRTWGNPAVVETGIKHKLSVFSLFTEYYKSPLNYALGLGPGHTVTRLGLLLPKYAILERFGATVSPVTDAVTDANERLWMSRHGGSSFWSMYYSWAGVWGDLGALGLAAYLYLGFLVWRYLCREDLLKFFLLNVLLFGCIFAWIDEPAYILFVALLIGLRWQEQFAVQPVIAPHREPAPSPFAVRRALSR